MGRPARDALRALRAGGQRLCVAPQNLIEFRNLATRPVAVNGLGFDIATVEKQIADFEASFELVPETGQIYPAWKSLVSAAAVIGKQVHDARLVAVCQVSAMSHVLTFNVRDFARFAAFVPNLNVSDPTSVAP